MPFISAKSKAFAITIAGAALLLGQYSAIGQRVSAVSSGRVGAVNSGGGVGAAVRGMTPQSAGQATYGVSEAGVGVVHARTSDSTSRLGRESIGERVFTGSSGTFGSPSHFMSTNDFPVTDFVGTMPGPIFSSAAGTASQLPGSGFGLTLSTPPLPSHKASQSGATHRNAIGSLPHSRLKDPDAILNPFTHSINVGLGKPVGTGLGSPIK